VNAPFRLTTRGTVLGCLLAEGPRRREDLERRLVTDCQEGTAAIGIAVDALIEDGCVTVSDDGLLEFRSL
jgi:hypothetical protein